MPKITTMETTKVVDINGEIHQEVTSFSWSAGKEPEYVKIYLENIMILAEIQGWVSKIMYELIKSVSYADKGQYIIVNAGYKRILAENLNIKPQTVTNAITELANKKILLRKDRGVFQLNPQYFGKGDWKDISKIRYEIAVGLEGKTIKLLDTEQQKSSGQQTEIEEPRLVENF